MHQDDRRQPAANLPASGKVAWSRRVAPADARAAISRGERRLARRAAPVLVREPQDTAMTNPKRTTTDDLLAELLKQQLPLAPDRQDDDTLSNGLVSPFAGTDPISERLKDNPDLDREALERESEAFGF